MGKSLIAFYSRADENYVNGTLKMLSVGNTEVAAGIIKELTGADMFKIEQAKPYSKGYNACIKRQNPISKGTRGPNLRHTPKRLIIMM